MGVDFHITRAEFWAENEDETISEQEWKQYVEQDSELDFHPENGNNHAVWKGESEHEEPWLDWFEGNIYTKWPDTALYEKMLKIAQDLGAHVQDDDGTNYPSEADWRYSPKERENYVPPSPSRPWWKFWK